MRSIQKMHRLLAVCAALLLTSTLAGAMPASVAQAPAPAADPALERRVTAVSQQLRCVVCQNQTIADSQADLAVDLRQQVREQLARGMSEQAVLDYVAQRYGDFVLYNPPLRPSTIVLWGAPFLLVIAGVLALRARVHAPAGARGPHAPVTASDLARANALLGDGRNAP